MSNHYHLLRINERNQWTWKKWKSAEWETFRMTWLLKMSTILHHTSMTTSPFPPVDIIWTIMIFCRRRRKIIRTVLCCVRQLCAMVHAHTHVSNSLCWVLILRLVFLCLFRFRCVFFGFSFDYFVLVFDRFSFFSTTPTDWLGRMSPKWWPIMCLVGR